ncbi:MAG: response regulator [Chloroflexi bacterium]|nr:response regulator [Chloroflexota bacterium]
MTVKKILIADDEAYIRLLIEDALEDFSEKGVTILTAQDGEAALRIIKDEEPSLVFLDVMMPKMNGFDVCQMVKNELGLAHVHIILLTAKGQRDDIERGQAVGADDYITKPFDTDRLVDQVAAVLGKTEDTTRP